jgi:hypothetical protein
MTMHENQVNKNWYTLKKENQDNIVVYGTATIAICSVIGFQKEIGKLFSTIFSARTIEINIVLAIVFTVLSVVVIVYLWRKVKKYKRVIYQDVNKIQVDVTPNVSVADTKFTVKWLLKLYFSFRNNSRFAIVLDDLLFKTGTGIVEHPSGYKKISAGNYKPEFYLKNIGAEEIWLKGIVLEPSQSTKTFISIKDDFGKEAIENALKNKTTGNLSFRVTLLDDPLVTHKFEESY